MVTGAASGIGAATARRLAAEGAKVFVADRNEAGAREVAGEIDGEAVVMDVLDLDSIRTGMEAAGPLDILVNNAGGGERGLGWFVHIAPEDWEFQLRLNLHGVLAVTQQVVGGMRERGRGAIVNVASEAGRGGSAMNIPYSAAKAGVIGFTKAVALEFARYGIRCNAVAPGPIATPLLDMMSAGGEAGERLRQGMIDSTRMGRAGTPDEVAGAIAFLASDDAGFVTGETLGVSGGLRMD
ncbi:MAG: 2-hydroxycyclohexanecarboxyl-CoA dehydrogenase [Solirubrobacteraceae bacterium]|nr:2-hydroxycyclohexanecarboxyl-CoA dehydrogenase [Solirubrobacteraceae bacterium]